MREHYPTVVPGQSWRVELVRPAMRRDGSSFDDHAIHRVLRESGIQQAKGEWYRCTVREVERAIRAVTLGENTIMQRDRDFPMRPEQEEAVRRKWYIILSQQ
ncbi:MAG: hypothetical protein IJ776_01095 [Paludibacteraceae bacterium]|nr:hypothetical protein [Paludibacteraceae bacterium]